MKQSTGILLPEYNGYSSKFTWLVSLWLDNDYGLYHLITEWADEVQHQGQLVERVKDLVEDQNPLADAASLYADIMGYALAQVNYDEVVNSYWEERSDPETPDDDGCDT